MGFRTVVMLSNDRAYEWEHDAHLGRKIMDATSWANGRERERANVDSYGQVVECCHADTQTLAVLGFYTRFTPIDGQMWKQDESDDAAALRLLKSAANKLGYRLVKKPA